MRSAFGRLIEPIILETAVGRTKGCIFLAFQQGIRRQHAHCLQRRNNDAGASKKCAILFVATFTHKVNFEIPKIFKIFIALSELVSGQLPFLGSYSTKRSRLRGFVPIAGKFKPAAVPSTSSPSMIPSKSVSGLNRAVPVFDA